MGGERLDKDLTVDDFRRFRDYIHQHSGIYLEESKLDSLHISLITRATRFQLQSLQDYFNLLTTDDAEFKELINLVTINETSFFRFPGQFEALKGHVLPEIMEHKSGGTRTFRVWSAGCSTGEEPYTTAMTLYDAGLDGLGWQPQVLGTDVSTKALAIAKAGEYSYNVRGLDKETVSRHFEDTGRGLRVAPHVRKLVDFGYHNLIKEPYPLSLMGNWDVIFCRNVTIYFRLESTRRVVANFFNSLNPGGYLFIGHSETLTTISDDFEPVEVGGVFLYRKPMPKPGRLFSGFSAGGRDAGCSRVEPEVRRGWRERMAERTASTEGRQRFVVDPGSGRIEEDTSAHAARRGPAAREQSAEVTAQVAALLAEARKAFAEGRTAEVEPLVQRILDLDANVADAHILSAYLYADAGRYCEALDACNRALAINPLLPYARYILGVIHQRQGDIVRAVSELKKTVYIDPDFALAHLNLANVYRTQGKWDAAAREYENAMRALYKNPEGAWSEFMGGFQPDLLARTCERSLIECRKAMGIA